MSPGDIDRPLVTSVVYNNHNCRRGFSKGFGAAGYRTLSGIRTQEHKGSGFNELLFDDTGSLRARMGTTHQATALNLGKLDRPTHRTAPPSRVCGAELRTDAAIALRAAQGMLLTTYARTDASTATGPRCSNYWPNAASCSLNPRRKPLPPAVVRRRIKRISFAPVA
ncbi:type VI secretion system Vgr family protein [Pseudomonas syringae]